MGIAPCPELSPISVPSTTVISLIAKSFTNRFGIFRDAGSKAY
jgi:hypothetical protein